MQRQLTGLRKRVEVRFETGWICLLLSSGDSSRPPKADTLYFYDDIFVEINFTVVGAEWWWTFTFQRALQARKFAFHLVSKFENSLTSGGAPVATDAWQHASWIDYIIIICTKHTTCINSQNTAVENVWV